MRRAWASSDSQDRLRHFLHEERDPVCPFNNLRHDGPRKRIMLRDALDDRCCVAMVEPIEGEPGT